MRRAVHSGDPAADAPARGGCSRRRFTLGSLAAATLAWLPPGPARAATWAPFGRTPVIDGLGGPGSYGGDDFAPLTAAELADVRASGLTAVNVTLGSVGRYAGAFEDALKSIAHWEAQIEAHPGFLLRIERAADLERARREQRLGLVYGFQDSAPFGEDLERIAMFRRLGLRVAQLTYNNRNLVGDGCLEPGGAGLSKFGRKVLERLNAEKLLVDLSHGGRQVTLDAIAASTAPVVISHTGCAALAALPRNKTDEELRALAVRGGVAGIYFMPFLRTAGQPMAEDLVRHIEHAVAVCGEDHVGLGSDGPISPVPFDEKFREAHREDVRKRRALGISAPGEVDDVYTFIPDLNTPRRFEAIAVLLSARGHSDARIGKILGGNFARVMGEVWG